jgi:hypothetical protein
MAALAMRSDSGADLAMSAANANALHKCSAMAAAQAR